MLSATWTTVAHNIKALSSIRFVQLLSPMQLDLLHGTRGGLVWESKPNSMVAGARPNHQPIGDLEPTQAGLGPVEEPDTLKQCAPVFPVFFWNKLYFMPFGYSCPTLASLRAIALSASARAGQRRRRVRRERRLATYPKKSSMTGM